MVEMGYDTETINEKITWITEMKQKGFQGCPMRVMAEQEVSE
jgi:hypothetical protein